MKRALLVVVLVIPLILAGCGGVLPHFRFAPNEEQKQSAQATGDLAQIAASSGLPPGSAAARQMAAGARTSRFYVGPPKHPIDVTDLVPPAVIGAWHAREAKADAHALKSKVLVRTSDVTSEALADLAASMEGQAKIDADQAIYRTHAIVEISKMGAEIADAIPIPGAPQLSAEEAERLSRLDKALEKVQATAAVQAARRPTVAEVADATEDQVLGTIDRIGQMADDYGLLGLVPGGAAVFYAVRKRKQAKEARAESDQAHEGEKVARAEVALARDGVEAARRDVDAARGEIIAARREAADTAKAAMEKVAETATAAVANGLTKPQAPGTT